MKEYGSCCFLRRKGTACAQCAKKVETKVETKKGKVETKRGQFYVWMVPVVELGGESEQIHRPCKEHAREGSQHLPSRELPTPPRTKNMGGQSRDTIENAALEHGSERRAPACRPPDLFPPGDQKSQAFRREGMNADPPGPASGNRCRWAESWRDYTRSRIYWL